MPPPAIWPKLHTRFFAKSGYCDSMIGMPIMTTSNGLRRTTGMAEAAREFTFENGPVEIPITGRSMHPAFPEGSRVRMEPVSFPFRPGRVYAFMKNNHLCAHRFVSMRGEKAEFIGDANRDPEFVHESRVIGYIPGSGSHVRTRLAALINAILVRTHAPLMKRLRIALLSRLYGKSIFRSRI
ncbi:MAG: hypothetical protein GF410_06655 [Chitinivibrionales bacterium]|nr:hypothetical protein [Chitinivibrionales bacterium]